jgi:hypothetical protein
MGAATEADEDADESFRLLDTRLKATKVVVTRECCPRS